MTTSWLLGPAVAACDDSPVSSACRDASSDGKRPRAASEATLHISASRSWCGHACAVYQLILFGLFTRVSSVCSLVLIKHRVGDPHQQCSTPSAAPLPSALLHSCAEQCLPRLESSHASRLLRHSPSLPSILCTQYITWAPSAMHSTST